MNTAIAFLIEISVTLVIVALVLVYLRPFLRRILLDLCGTDERAQFWTSFTNIIVLALPLLTALGFTPSANTGTLTLEVVHQVRSNLMNFILGLVLIGFILLFFSASASRTPKREKQIEPQK
jgi:hypothetical protein